VSLSVGPDSSGKGKWPKIYTREVGPLSGASAHRRGSGRRLWLRRILGRQRPAASGLGVRLLALVILTDYFFCWLLKLRKPLVPGQDHGLKIILYPTLLCLKKYFCYDAPPLSCVAPRVTRANPRSLAPPCPLSTPSQPPSGKAHIVMAAWGCPLPGALRPVRGGA
jgi:hypothetical protein